MRFLILVTFGVVVGAITASVWSYYSGNDCPKFIESVTSYEQCLLMSNCKVTVDDIVNYESKMKYIETYCE